MEYTLDADWVINALAKKRRADEVLKQLGPAGIGISIVTLGELYEGPFGTPHPEPEPGVLARVSRTLSRS
jgi:predicted nucleic acid-binding protein